jgi:CubicO group peptidase (beta-lactamase class C family)
MRTFVGQSRSRRRPAHVAIAELAIAAALFFAGCSPTSSTPTASTGTRAAPSPGPATTSPALKPIDRDALEATVDKTARQLLVPGAVVVLRTPQGAFTATYGTTMLGAATSPGGDTHFRIASNTKTNHSFAAAAGGVISTADDLATWIRALVSGRVLDAAYQRRWLDSPEPEYPNAPAGQRYGYGIAQLRWGPNTLYFHGGETPGFNSFIGYDLVNQVALVVWTNLTVSLDGSPTANAIMVNVLDQIYAVSPLAPRP